jgi:hypothetical protein
MFQNITRFTLEMDSFIGGGSQKFILAIKDSLFGIGNKLKESRTSFLTPQTRQSKCDNIYYEK